MEKYKLNNLDCANCTLKIEETLNKINSVKYAKINFATKVLKIDYSGDVDINKIVTDIESDVKVTDIKEEEEDLNIKKEIIKLIIPTILFIIGIVFNDFLKNTYYGIGEYVVFLSAYLLTGYKVLLNAVKNILKGDFFDENFLMSIATIGAILINALPEAAGVMLFYNIGEFLEDLSLNKSRKSIKSLVSLKPNFANLVLKNEIKKINPENLKLDNIIIVNPGEKVPVDGLVISGESLIDT